MNDVKIINNNKYMNKTIMIIIDKYTYNITMLTLFLLL